MTFRSAVMAAGIVWAAGVAFQAPGGVQAQQKTVWDGVYSEAQATRGATAYERDCASCHQADMGGDGFAPGLAGPEFAAAWEGLTVGDLLERIRISMPPSEPGSVTLAAKADILAHMLKLNRFPAGAAELAADVEATKQIKYTSAKP
ncbi:MAG: c-type cytochrome [Acidobacteria bacterium]|nr:c-type cytochrome [Acidobacteriota bacterium]